MVELVLPEVPQLNEYDPQARHTYRDAMGTTTIVDTRMPLHRLRRRELLKMAEEAGFDVSETPLKDELIKMLEAPRSVRAQVTAGRNLAQAKVQAELDQVSPRMQSEPTLGAPQLNPFIPREPAPHEMEAAKDEARMELRKMPFFKLKAVLATRGVIYSGGDRERPIEDYIKRVEQDEEARLSAS